jgi:hypothetical protein
MMLAVLAVPLLSVTAAFAAVQLSEILADPASDWNGDGEVHFRDDEWIEVTNTGPETVYLTEYFVKDAMDDEAHLNLFGVLAPGEVAVFYGSNAVAWQQENGHAMTGLSLNNGGDEVTLWRGDPGYPGAELVDMYIYVDHEAEDDRASGRLHLGGEWALFDGLNPYVGTTVPLGTGCDPSPDVLNDCQPNVPSAPFSWGTVKVDYR